MPEKTVWRECEFGKRCVSSPDNSIRECRVRGDMVVLVNSHDCAACPVPALVEAVRESRDTLHAMRKPHSIGTDAEDMCEAALALLPKEESRG